MNKTELLKRLDQLFDEAAAKRLWCTVEITFQNGVPTLFRKITTEKLINEGNTHARPYEKR
ncbi:MAG TPA: hypothetical protein VMD77_00330 [Candidatus Baltobacteraceae bacterium]|nr:hypothetical protein [Candidatus Baltobacteraceae bacterium]